MRLCENFSIFLVSQSFSTRRCAVAFFQIDLLLLQADEVASLDLTCINLFRHLLVKLIVNKLVNKSTVSLQKWQTTDVGILSVFKSRRNEMATSSWIFFRIKVLGNPSMVRVPVG